MLADDFPLSDFGEAFIENELPYISTYFSEVIFVPRFARRNKVRASVTHTLKAGYTVIRPRQTPKAAIIRRVLRCALSPSLIRTSMDEVRAASKHGQTRPYLQVLKRLLMLEVRVSMVAQTLRECDYLGPRPVFYSFWLHGSAYVARRLSEEFGGVAVSRA